MDARLLVRRRVAISDAAFAELVVWQLPSPVRGSAHSFKYRLAFVRNERCVMRFDNEAGKGDHMHLDDREYPYAFTTIDRLLKDFLARVRELEDENAQGQD